MQQQLIRLFMRLVVIRTPMDDNQGWQVSDEMINTTVNTVVFTASPEIPSDTIRNCQKYLRAVKPF